jgi:hypothetical protein
MLDNNLLVFESFHDERFKTIKLSCVEDKNLSWKAKAIQMYIISRPPGWKINQNDLQGRSIDGSTSLQSGIRELMKAEYLFRMVRRSPHKQILQWGYLCFEDSISKEEAKKMMLERKPDWEIYERKNEEDYDDPLSTGNLNIGNNAPLIYINTNNNHSVVIQETSKEVSLITNTPVPLELKESNPSENFLLGKDNPRPPRKFNRNLSKSLPPISTLPDPAEVSKSIRYDAIEAKQSKKIPPVPIQRVCEDIIMLMEYWDGLGFKLPDPDRAVKTYNKTVQALKQIQNGSLIPGEKRKFSIDDIKESMTKFSLYVFDSGYGPQKQAAKDSLAKNVGLKEFLYNPFGNVKSYFIKFVVEEVPVRIDVNMAPLLHPEVTEKLKGFYCAYALSGIKKRFNEREENKFREAANELNILLQKKGYRFPSVAGLSEMADLLCDSIRDNYKEKYTKVYPGSFASPFARHHLVQYLGEKGYITDYESNHHWDYGQ